MDVLRPDWDVDDETGMPADGRARRIDELLVPYPEPPRPTFVGTDGLTRLVRTDFTRDVDYVCLEIRTTSLLGMEFSTCASASAAVTQGRGGSLTGYVCVFTGAYGYLFVVAAQVTAVRRACTEARYLLPQQPDGRGGLASHGYLPVRLIGTQLLVDRLLANGVHGFRCADLNQKEELAGWLGRFVDGGVLATEVESHPDHPQYLDVGFNVANDYFQQVAFTDVYEAQKLALAHWLGTGLAPPSGARVTIEAYPQGYGSGSADGALGGRPLYGGFTIRYWAHKTPAEGPVGGAYKVTFYSNVTHVVKKNFPNFGAAARDVVVYNNQARAVFAKIKDVVTALAAAAKLYGGYRIELSARAATWAGLEPVTELASLSLDELCVGVFGRPAKEAGVHTLAVPTSLHTAMLVAMVRRAESMGLGGGAVSGAVMAQEICMVADMLCALTICTPRQTDDAVRLRTFRGKTAFGYMAYRWHGDTWVPRRLVVTTGGAVVAKTVGTWPVCYYGLAPGLFLGKAQADDVEAVAEARRARRQRLQEKAALAVSRRLAGKGGDGQAVGHDGGGGGGAEDDDEDDDGDDDNSNGDDEDGDGVGGAASSHGRRARKGPVNRAFFPKPLPAAPTNVPPFDDGDAEMLLMANEAAGMLEANRARQQKGGGEDVGSGGDGGSGEDAGEEEKARNLRNADVARFVELVREMMPVIRFTEGGGKSGSSWKVRSSSGGTSQVGGGSTQQRAAAAALLQLARNKLNKGGKTFLAMDHCDWRTRLMKRV